MLLTMSKVEIVGVKTLFFQVLEVLQDLGTLHLEDITKKRGPRYADLIPMEMDPALEEERNLLQNLAMRNNAILSELVPPDEKISRSELQKKYESFKGKTLGEISAMVEEEEKATRELLTYKNELEVELSRLSKYEPIIKKVYPLASKVTATENYTSIALLIEERYKQVLEYIQKELEKITGGQCEVFSARVDENTHAAILVFHRRYSEQVHNFLAAENVNQVRLPSELADKPYDEALKEIEERLNEIPPKLKKVREELEEISNKWYLTLVALKDYLADRIESLNAIPKFGQSGHVFVITGWMPSDKVEETRRILEEKFEGKVELTEEVPSHDEMEEAPTALRNPGPVRPFEFIYMLIKPPKYGHIDPTFLVAIFFPLLFGFMLGDMGYALVLIGVVFLMKRILKKRESRSLFFELFTNVLLICSISSFVFGLLYFEFFGDLLFRLFGWKDAAGHLEVQWIWGYTSNGKPFGWPLERIAQANPDMFKLLLIIVIIIGVLHMGGALLIGLIDGIRHKDRKHAIEKAGYLLFILGLVVIFGSLWGIKGAKSVAVPLGAVMALVGIGAAGYGGGFGGGLEAALTFGNLLSYARLYGIGLASVILAEVSNELGAEFGGGAMIVIGVVVAALLHTLNIALGVLSPSIQSLRLNLVESFTKFYKESDVVYKPFKRSGGE
ncbi:MAG: V-type ATPase 116kDa subunit family protein [Actinomycetota bacterium]|nr:V-type ATPase 116kDa subunit family protein [Actinomycetota bacterium]